MHRRQLIFALGVATSMCATYACGRSRSVSAPATTRTTIKRLQLRCAPQSELLLCEALATDDATDGRDVTDAVQWSASDAREVVVQRGRIHVNRGHAATVTATWLEAEGKPSASVMVLGDALRGQTRQGYVVNGEVRTFPLADGVGGAQVSLIDEDGVARSVTTSSGDAQGQFRFGPVSAGTYRLRAVCDGYRSTEETVVVPDNKPHYTLTLLPEPKKRS